MLYQRFHLSVEFIHREDSGYVRFLSSEVAEIQSVKLQLGWGFNKYYELFTIVTESQPQSDLWGS